MSEPRLITCTGYGNSGSSAGTNLLEEFDCVQSFSDDFEFTFLHEADGVGDLESALREGHRLKVDLAVKRFLDLSARLSEDPNYRRFFNGNFLRYANEYIDSIIDFKWDGHWHRAFEVRGQSAEEALRYSYAREIYRERVSTKKYGLYEADKWAPEYKPIREEYYAHGLEEPEYLDRFLRETRRFTSKLLREKDPDGKYAYSLIDQAIPAYDVAKYSRYFESARTIIIDRDPRDLYACNKAEWGSRYIPTRDVDTFIDWFRASRSPRSRDIHRSDQVIFVLFESLIYDYEETRKRIMDFAGLGITDHTRPRTSFVPERSRANTQLFRKYPRLAADISRIGEELAEFCYPYDGRHRAEIAAVGEGYVYMEDIMAEADAIQKGSDLGTVRRAEAFFAMLRMTRSARCFAKARERKGIARVQELIKAFLFVPFAALQLPFFFARLRYPKR